MTLFADRILALPKFDRALRDIAVMTTEAELADIVGDANRQSPNWNFALTCASSLTAIDSEEAQDAVLRVAQGCIRAQSTTTDQKAAAVLLLQRVGNQPAISLANERGFAELPSLRQVPPQLALDSARRQAQLTIPPLSKTQPLNVNPFQKMFWETIQGSSRVSVSAPTSAGKSFIVRHWIRTELARHDSLRVAYLAPTRALVEEVSAVLRLDLPAEVAVHTLPWDPTIARSTRQVFVMTQERLHLLLHRMPGLAPDVVFIDEAQKIAEGTRGILLSQVLDETILRRPDVSLVFASPLSANPEVLVGNGESKASSIVAETVTVNQSLVFAKQVPRKRAEYAFTLSYRSEELPLGRLILPRPPGGDGQKVPVLAAAVGASSGANLVYANGPAEAEKYARRIYDELGPEGDRDDHRLDDLIEFARGVVHERFSLATVARRGVAFHYGDMPLVLKAKVEELFRVGAIRFLVCTSTLLEGVNLPCKNIFMRAPRKGQSHMSLGDFWNLAGRAGRWGQEFQGNIICIDVDDERAWPEKPGIRRRTVIAPAARQVFGSSEDLLAYIHSGAPKASSAVAAELESVFSWLAGRAFGRESLPEPFGAALDVETRQRLASSVNDAITDLTVDADLIRKHAGISPLSIQRLYEAVLEHGRPDRLALVPPSSDEAFDEYKIALDYVADYLGGSFQPELRRLSLARLLVHWMRGVPLSVIIENRARFRRQRGETVVYPRLIRKVMEDVEDIARFEAPKYLSCYADVVSLVAFRLGTEGFPQALNIDMMLELGVPRITDMSLIAIGLSRASTMAISRYLIDDDLNPETCRDWMQSVVAEDLDVPAFAVREVQALQLLLEARANGE